MKFLKIFMVLILVFACKQKADAKLTAQDIIDKAIAVHCTGNCENSIITFDFRGRQYKATKKDGLFSYERQFKDSIRTVRDVLTNSGFKRFINDSVVQIKGNIAIKYANSVNSVHYFAQLPYGLNAPAVKKELLGEATIKGKPYYKIGVSFNEEGGGVDFEDKFVYWIDQTDFALDYLAYDYAVNGGGIRFREALNKRVVNGITFMDYKNYKPKAPVTDLQDLAGLFEDGALDLLSTIETKNVEVQLH